MRDAVQIIMTLTAIFVMLIIMGMVIAIEIRINTKAIMHHHEATIEHVEKIKE